MHAQDFEVTLDGTTMGTTYCIKYVWHAQQSLLAPEVIKHDIDHLLAEVNRQMSTFQPDSEISQFNRRSAHSPMPISADFAFVLAEAIGLYRITQGGLDVTQGGVVNLWGFGPEKHTRIPSDEQVQAALQHGGMDKLQLNTATQPATLTKSDEHLYLDLSSIAKGFGVDKVAEYLQQQHIMDYMVEIGGEIRAHGKNVIGDTWQIAIEHPQQDAFFATILLDNQALATSGDYKKFHTHSSGSTFVHTINPKTGQAVRHDLASLSVIAPTSMQADGLATGLFVQGAQTAWDIAQQANIPVLLIIRQANGSLSCRMSDAFASLIV